MNQTLDFLKQLAHGLAVQFGSSCEVVIHDLTRKGLEQSIVYIENGHVSNRHTGDGPSGIVLETLRSDPGKIRDKLAYLTKTDNGRILKSSTLYIRDEKGNVRYIFSMNYDITALLAAENLIRGLVQTEPEETPDGSSDTPPQKITHNVTELLDMLIDQAIAKVGKPVALMNKDDKVAVVQYLNNAGAFLITKSGDKVSSFLGSRNLHFTAIWTKDNRPAAKRLIRTDMFSKNYQFNHYLRRFRNGNNQMGSKQHAEDRRCQPEDHGNRRGKEGESLPRKLPSVQHYPACKT